MDKKTLSIVIVLILVIVGLYFLLGNKGVQKETGVTSPTPTAIHRNCKTYLNLS